MIYKFCEKSKRNLDKQLQETFDWLVFEVAGMREETLVMHHDHKETRVMNILVEMEMQLQRSVRLIGIALNAADLELPADAIKEIVDRSG